MLKRLYYRVKAQLDPESSMSHDERSYHARRLGIDPEDLDTWDETVATRFRIQYDNARYAN